ncbi:MAG: hypothetical protein ABIR62_09640, partial [Dokdonella sp.]
MIATTFRVDLSAFALDAHLLRRHDCRLPAAANAPASMDEITFRQLLSRHVTSLLDERTLAKGADYVRRGRVLATHYEPGKGEGALIGKVKGTAPSPYVAGMRLISRGKRIELDSYCTCPVEVDCKHVAATALFVMRGGMANPALEIAPPAGPQLGPWKQWLEALQPHALHAPVVSAVVETKGTERVVGIALRIGSGALPILNAQAVWLTPGKRGGFVSPRPIKASLDDPAPWAVLRGDEFRMIADLRMRTPSIEGGGYFDLHDVAGEALLEELLATLPCYLDKPSNGLIKLGARHALRIGWIARDDGTQKLALSVDAAAPATRLLRIGGLWYFDPAAHEIGRVDGETRLAEAVLRAPPLLPEQVPLLMARWHEAPLLATLPKPDAAAEIERRDVSPIPVLTLRALALTNISGVRYQAGLVRLGFDYGGVRVPMFPAPARERRRVGDRVIEIVRDRASEVAASE